MKYLKFKSIDEIYKYEDLRAKYGITKEQAEVEGLLRKHEKDGLIILPERENNVSKKEYRKIVNRIKYDYLQSLSEVTNSMLVYFKTHYLDNPNLRRYDDLSHEYKHIIIFNDNQNWVRTINSKKYNALSTKGISGILVKHNDENVFLTKLAAFKCKVTGNKIHKRDEIEIIEPLSYFI